MKSGRNNVKKVSGDCLGVRFGYTNDIDIGTYGLHRVNEVNDNITIKKNHTVSSPAMGPQDGERCIVCHRFKDCPGHSGEIQTGALYVKPELVKVVIGVLRHVCPYCHNLVASSNKCVVCKTERPQVNHLYDSHFNISTPNINKSIQLDTGKKLHDYMMTTDWSSLMMALKISTPSISPNFTIDNLFSSIVIVLPNKFRHHRVTAKNKTMPSEDTKKLMKIVNIDGGTSTANAVSAINTITDYFEVAVEDDDANKTSSQEMPGKFGGIRRNMGGRTTNGVARIVATSDTTQGLLNVGLNANTANLLKMAIYITNDNVDEIRKIFMFDERVRKNASVERNGRIYILDQDRLSDIMIREGDIVHMPLNNERSTYLVTSRHPIIEENSMSCMKCTVDGNKTSGIGQSPASQEKEKGDFDGDETGCTKSRYEADANASYILMNNANTIFSTKHPGIVSGITEEAVTGLLALSISKATLSFFKFSTFFYNCHVRLYYEDKDEYSCKDIITAIILESAINIDVNLYGAGSREAAAFGMKASNLVVKDGIFVSGLLTISSIITAQTSLINTIAQVAGVDITTLTNIINALNMIGLYASAFFGFGDTLDTMLSKGHGYDLNKSMNLATLCKTEDFINALNMKHSIFTESDSDVSALTRVCTPNTSYMENYFKNLYGVTTDSGDVFNNFVFNDLGGVGTNAQHAFSTLGYGSLTITSGNFIGYGLRYGRMTLFNKIGELDAVTKGLHISNLCIGTTPKEQLIEHSVASYSFVIRNRQVIPAGTTLNGGKAFQENRIISQLDVDIKDGNVAIGRTFGVAGLNPSRCRYADLYKTISIRLMAIDFKGSKYLNDTYNDAYELVKLKADNLKSMDIYDHGSRQLIFWDKSTILNRVIVDVDDGFEAVRGEGKDESDILALYEQFIKSLYGFKGNPVPFSWSRVISFIIVRFITDFPPFEAVKYSYSVVRLYFDKVKIAFHECSFHRGTFIGDKVVGATLVDTIQQQLDAHKKPGVKIERSILKNVLGPEITNEESKMYVTLKEEVSDEDAQLLVKGMKWVRIMDVLDRQSGGIKYNDGSDPKFNHAISQYVAQTNEVVEITTYYECVFKTFDMALNNVSALSIYAALKELNNTGIDIRGKKGGMTQTKVIPLLVNYDKLVVCIAFEHETENEKGSGINLTAATSFSTSGDVSHEVVDKIEVTKSVARNSITNRLVEKVANITVSGIVNILAAKLLISKSGIRYVVLNGFNMEAVSNLSEIDPDTILSDNIYQSARYVGLMGACNMASAAASFSFATSDPSFVDSLVVSRFAHGGIPTPMSRHGSKNAQPDSILKHIMFHPPFESAANGAIRDVVDYTNSSLIESLMIGKLPKIGTNSIEFGIDINKIVKDNKKKMDFNYVKNLFKK